MVLYICSSLEEKQIQFFKLLMLTFETAESQGGRYIYNKSLRIGGVELHDVCFACEITENILPLYSDHSQKKVQIFKFRNSNS